MSADAAEIIPLLARLVAADTRNPPRAITAGDPVFEFIQKQLPGFSIQLTDHGEGSVALLAVRGTPRIIFNFHIDTVPATESWETDPHKLELRGRKAIGLGACDIKGALACMLATAADTPGDLAILVTTDEEAGVGQAVNRFLAVNHDFEAAVIAEPTDCQAVLAHRGIVSARAVFKGVAGHASDARVDGDSANHRALRWASQSLELAAQWADQEEAGLKGVPFNIGRIEGGIKPNMIAERCEARFALRTLPGQNGIELLDQLKGLADPNYLANWDITFSAPPLPATGAGEGARILADKLGLSVAAPVNFWSEAALFSAAGMDALVLGSGNIAQAHAANEWVALAQLEKLADIYREILTRGNV